MCADVRGSIRIAAQESGLCHFESGSQHDRWSCDDPRVEIVLTTSTPDGVTVVLPALVYAKILEEHAAVADLGVIDRTIRRPDERRPDPRPDRERFLRREAGLWVLAVVESARFLPSSRPCSPPSVHRPDYDRHHGACLSCGSRPVRVVRARGRRALSVCGGGRQAGALLRRHRRATQFASTRRGGSRI